jgi:CRP/FNR family transcriptional regulator, cyclic AMP receptor protein
MTTPQRRPVEALMAEHPFFVGIDPGLPPGVAHLKVFAPGELLFSEGQQADALYLIHKGRVALDIHATGAPAHRLDTVEAGEAVGWSWLVDPHRWFFDAEAVDEVAAIVINAELLRAYCEADPAWGYQVMRRIAEVMYHRLQAARIRLLDLYGDPHAR